MATSNRNAVVGARMELGSAAPPLRCPLRPLLPTAGYVLALAAGALHTLRYVRALRRPGITERERRVELLAYLTVLLGIGLHWRDAGGPLGPARLLVALGVAQLLLRCPDALP